ncbi:LolA family protein [Burkholderia plantarii]|nr:outer membrane lipoprotein carrier protein LolA [Burkholderia plantarii]
MGISRGGRGRFGALVAAVVCAALGCGVAHGAETAGGSAAAGPNPNPGSNPAPADRSPAHMADAGLVAEVTGRLARAGTLRARFTQTQTLAAMNKPLVSTGSMLIDRAAGIVWRIETPYRATYVITDGGVREVDANGQPRSTGSGGGRGVAQVARMMRGLLAGDLSALYSQFDVTVAGTPARWRMTLRPNQPQLQQALGVLQMSGGDTLRTLAIDYANGNQTMLEFSGTTRVDAPSALERGWLEAR